MKKVVFFITIILLSVNTFARAKTVDPLLIETPVVVKTLSGTISGTLMMPKNASGKIPVVLIIGDGGAIDRDGNNPKVGLSANTYKLLAEDLGKKGIASLRYDKRMVGQSVTVVKENQLKIDDYSDDAIALIGMLNDDERFSKVILFGHGEGSIVAMIASVDQPVKGFITAEGAGVQADKLLIEQMKSKSSFLSDEFKAILDSLRKGKMTDKVDPSLYYIARPSIQPFLMSWCRCIPARGIKVIKCPVLIIQGTTDLQIGIDNAEKLKKARSEAQLVLIKGMNHIFREAPADEEQNAATWEKPDLPLKPEMVTAVVEFVNRIK